MITSADARPGTIRKITAPGRFYTVKTKFKFNDVYINIRIRHYTFNKNSKSGSDGGENHAARTVAVKISRFILNQNRPVPDFSFNEPTKRCGIQSNTSTGTAQDFLKGLLS